MSPSNETREARGLHEALSYLERALRLLDQADAPGEIGAKIDHAIHQLRDTLATSAASNNRPGEPNDN
jgi:hypothetical protein